MTGCFVRYPFKSKAPLVDTVRGFFVETGACQGSTAHCPSSNPSIAAHPVHVHPAAVTGLALQQTALPLDFVAVAAAKRHDTTDTETKVKGSL